MAVHRLATPIALDDPRKDVMTRAAQPGQGATRRPEAAGGSSAVRPVALPHRGHARQHRRHPADGDDKGAAARALSPLHRGRRHCREKTCHRLLGIGWHWRVADRLLRLLLTTLRPTNSHTNATAKDPRTTTNGSETTESHGSHLDEDVTGYTRRSNTWLWTDRPIRLEVIQQGKMIRRVAPYQSSC